MKTILLKRVISFLLCAIWVGAALLMPANGAEAANPTISYGLSVLAASTDMAMMAPVGNEIFFSQECFARAMNLSSIGSVTVRTLPAVTDGELLLGSTRVAAGQSIAGKDLASLVFSPAKDDTPLQSFFTFSVNGSATAVLCNLYLLDRGNCTPTVSMASGLSLNVSTYKGLSAYGTLNAYDPDGDALCFEIVSYPENGVLRLTDAAMGTYVYTPQKGYVGSDRFTYVARDRYGSYSASATVNLSVNLSGTSVTYADMAEHHAHNAAIALTEAGVMSGRQVGNAYYFYPEQEVNRVEFLVMAMNAVGIRSVPVCEKTVFADDGEIPDAMKGYVAAAYELGYIGGVDDAGALCFAPNEPLSCAQAAVILNSLIRPESAAIAPTFADAEEIPAWAMEAICALNAVGILPDDGGTIDAMAALTRADAARMLAAAMMYTA